VLSRRDGSSRIPWRFLSLVKKTLHRHRAVFEPQRASPFVKREKASQILELAVRTYTMIPLFVLPFTLLELFVSSTSDDQHLFEIATLCRPPPHQDWGRARTASNRFACEDKELGPQLGETITPENGLVKPPRRYSRAFSPAGMFGGKVPLRLAAQKRRPHAPPAPMRSAPAFFLGKWGV
jgi:hypothetical protein